jgi:hypothetical protein
VDAITAHPEIPDLGASTPSHRLVRLAVGAVLVVCALTAIAAGLLAAYARFAGTYVELGGHGTYRSAQYAVATDGTDWRGALLGWAGSARLQVAPAGGKPIVVGVAPAKAVDRFLAGAGYTTVSEHGGGLVRADHEGRAPSRVTAGAVDWTAYAEGRGTQTLEWTATHRRQVALALNADGSRPVDVRVVSSAVTLERMPWWVVAGPLALGIVVLPFGVFVFRRALCARHTVEA